MHSIYIHNTFPVLSHRLDHEGDVFRVTYSNQCRDSYQRVTPKEAEQFLRALHEFDSIMYREENIIKMKPEPGMEVMHRSFSNMT